jgi:hypothetical protein
MNRPGESGGPPRRSGTDACPLPTRIALSYLTNLAHRRGHIAVRLEAGSPVACQRRQLPWGLYKRPVVVTPAGHSSQPESAVLSRNVSTAGILEQSHSRRTPTLGAGENRTTLCGGACRSSILVPSRARGLDHSAFSCQGERGAGSWAAVEGDRVAVGEVPAWSPGASGSVWQPAQGARLNGHEPPSAPGAGVVPRQLPRRAPAA